MVLVLRRHPYAWPHWVCSVCACHWSWLMMVFHFHFTTLHFVSGEFTVVTTLFSWQTQKKLNQTGRPYTALLVISLGVLKAGELGWLHNRFRFEVKYSSSLKHWTNKMANLLQALNEGQAARFVSFQLRRTGLPAFATSAHLCPKTRLSNQWLHELAWANPVLTVRIISLAIWTSYTPSKHGPNLVLGSAWRLFNT